MTRRTLLSTLVCLAATLGACERQPYREVTLDFGPPTAPGDPSATDARAQPLRFSVAAMLSPRTTHAAYSALFRRVGTLLGVEVELVQRSTYAEVNELLLGGGLDAALVCTGGYLDLRARTGDAIDILAVPVVGGATTYQSLIIVPRESAFENVEDLRGRRFAFTDPLSLSGRAYVAALLRDRHGGMPGFFAETRFTRSHDRSIEAVAGGLVDGASVDSLVFAAVRRARPELADSVRVIARSPPLGIMPVVAAPALPQPVRGRLRSALLTLHLDDAAAPGLRAIGIDRFALPTPGLYDAAHEIMQAAR